MEKGYLENGQEVIIVKKLQEGYLIRELFDSGEGDIEGEVEFREKIYNIPPTEKLADVISKLNMEKHALNIQIAELKKKKLEEQGYLSKVSNIPNFQMVIDYFGGEFGYSLNADNIIFSKGSIFNSKNVSIELVKGELRLYTLEYDHFGSTRKWVTIFKTKEDAIAEQKRRIIAMISTCDYKGKLESIIESHPEITKDEEIKLLYENKIEELAIKSKVATIENAKKEIARYTKILEENI